MNMLSMTYIRDSYKMPYINYKHFCVERSDTEGRDNWRYNVGKLSTDQNWRAGGIGDFPVKNNSQQANAKEK